MPDRKWFTLEEIEQRKKRKLIVIENPDGRFKIIETVIKKKEEKSKYVKEFEEAIQKLVNEKGNLLSRSNMENDGSPMGVADLLDYYSYSYPDWHRRAELAISQYKKDFDFSDIENRYKTRIHNHEQESKKLRRYIYVEMPVIYCIRWSIPIALVYGLCLGIPKVIIWLSKLSGWHRIFLVYACTNLVIVVFICAFMPEIVSGPGHRHPHADDVIDFIFGFGIIPIGLIYVLGRGVGWAFRGFRKKD